jgi:hypothetical protein
MPQAKNAKERIAEWARRTHEGIPQGYVTRVETYPEFLADLAEVLGAPSVAQLLDDKPWQAPEPVLIPGPDFARLATSRPEACTCGPRDPRTGEAAERHDPDCPRSPLFGTLLESMTRSVDPAEVRRILAADRAASQKEPPLDLFEADDPGPCTHARTELTYPNNRYWVTCLDCGDVISEITGKVGGE